MALSLKIKKLLEFSMPIMVLTLVGVILQAVIVSQPEKVASWLSSFGPYFFLVYAAVQTAGIIFPPLPGAIFQLALIAIIGPAKGLLFIYFLVTPLYCINFLIAKKYGRPFVEKFLGKDSLAKIDHYAKDAGVGTLIMLKICMGNFFDFLSYGIGLTNISFKEFFWVNLLAGIPATILDYFIFSRSNNFLLSILLIGLVGLIFSGIYMFFHHLKHRIIKHKLS